MVFEQSTVVLKDGKKVVIKRFSDISSVKWFISIPFRPFYPFALSASERLKREYTFFNSSHELVRTPKVYSVNWKDKVLEREFVEGEPLAKFDVETSCRVLAKTLATLHREGWCLGDTKLTNIIISNGEIYVIDGEQAIRSNNELYIVWDIASSLILLGIYNPKEAMIESSDLLRMFYREYTSNGGNVKMIDRSLKVLKRFVGDSKWSLKLRF